MTICLNSRNLNPCQQTKIEEYFEKNFSFKGKKPTLIWREDQSEFILLGYPHGDQENPVSDVLTHDVGSAMVRIHENELMEIAGRSMFKWISDWYDPRTA